MPPKKYAHIDFTPPAKVARQAERGLDLRKAHNRGGTKIGVARARDLKNRRHVSVETIHRMVNYFTRHEVDKEGANFDDTDNPSAGKIAWLLWGGDPGRTWAKSILKKIEKADENE